MQMTTEHQPPILNESETVEELQEHQPTVFEESTAALLELLDTTPQRPRNPRFFRATWDAHEQRRLVGIDTMTARATGARKQELYGEFYQAQFEMTQRGSDDTESSEFIWIATGARRRGMPITLHLDSLNREYGYQMLNTSNVANVLINQIETMDDCTTLLRSLKDRTGISEAWGQITEAVNGFTSDFAYRDFASLKTGNMAENVDKLFSLLEVASEYGQDVPRTTQGYLVSRLLRAVADKRLEHESERLSSQEALDILESAFDRGVITSDHIVQRVFAFGPMYRYPSAIERMHSYLADRTHNRGPKNIVGTERTHFAATFVMTRLREEQLPEAVVAHMDNVRLSSEMRDSAKQNRTFLNDLLSLVARTIGSAEDVVQTTGIATTFEHVLELLHPEADDEQHALDQKCVEILSTVLSPSVAKKIGAKATRTEVEDAALLDADELEEW